MSTLKITKIRSLSERCHYFFDILTYGAEFVGANVLREDFRLTWLTWTVIGFIIGYFSFTLYTIYVGVVVEGDWSILLQALCFLGTGIQGCAKLLSSISFARRLRFLRSEIEGIYSDYENAREEYRLHLERSLDLVKKITVSLLFIYTLTPFGLICVPLYYRFFLKQRQFIMHFILPGLDANTDFGYSTLQTVHVICVFFGSFGNFASDCLCFLLVAHVPLMKNIFVSKLNDLDEILQHRNPGDSRKTSVMLKDIFQWHQKYLSFSDSAKDCFFWVIFVQIGTATSSIICTIVCQFLGVMPSGPIYLIYSFIIMYSFCALGNLVDIANDDITIAIYDCLWYELLVPEQKMLLIMLRESQKSEGMSIGGISPLSLNTALQVTKTIYTVAMILNEFFD